MNGQEALDLYRAYVEANPHFTPGERGPELWGLLLGDVDFGLAKAAMVKLLGAGKKAEPADIRRQVARATGVDSPPFDQIEGDVCTALLALGATTKPEAEARYLAALAWMGVHRNLAERAAVNLGVDYCRDALESPGAIPGVTRAQVAKAYEAAREATSPQVGQLEGLTAGTVHAVARARAELGAMVNDYNDRSARWYEAIEQLDVYDNPEVWDEETRSIRGRPKFQAEQASALLEVGCPALPSGGELAALGTGL